MNTDLQDLKYKELTEKIIKIFYRVYNKLGYGFLILALSRRLNAKCLIILENNLCLSVKSVSHENIRII